ncbi:MAG: hypothetical protein GY751_18315, partial [Bacteroidetes bacterium]|nr:hypothetical protein [Bacteroidota bacterium]
MGKRIVYIFCSLVVFSITTSIAAGPPVTFSKAQFQDQVLNMLTEELTGKIDESFHNAVDQAEVDLLKMSNFYYLLDDFKELGIDPANPQISQSLNGLYETLKERYDSGEPISKDEIKGYLTDNWKTIAAKVMDEESADIIEGSYNLAMDAWNKVQALEEITKAEEAMSEDEIMQVFKKWGISGKFLDKMGDLEVVLRGGYNYIAAPLEAANDVIGALSEKNPGKRIGLMFALGSKYSGKIPIIGDIVKQIFVLGEAVLKAANEMGGLLSRNFNQGCISDAGQFNLQNDERASSFLQQFPHVHHVCPLVFDPDGKKKVSSIYKHTYYDMDNANHLYFYINDKWLKGKEKYHRGDRDLRAIISWLRSNGMADKVDDEYLLFQLYNHSPGFIEYRERLQTETETLKKKLFGSPNVTEHAGVLSILRSCDKDELKAYISPKIPVIKLQKTFPISHGIMGWDQFGDQYSYVWDELDEHAMHCQYNRYLKNMDYASWSSGSPIDLLSDAAEKVTFTPIKIWGVVKNGGQLVEGATINFERSGSIYPGESCKELVTNERGNFIFYYLKTDLRKEWLSVEASDTDGKSNSEKLEIDLSKASSFYYTIDLKEEGDCEDGEEWNASAGACEVVCPANSTDVTNSDGLVIDCDCNEGYKWDAGRTECLEVPDSTTTTTDTTVTTVDTTATHVDCSSLPNMEEKYDAQNHKYYCDCKAGYKPDPNGNGCIEKQDLDDVDCSMYANTEARINPATGGVVCDCKSGYVWKEDRSGCISLQEDAMNRADCSQWPNTKPVWSPADNAVICDCIAGYEWDDDYTVCGPNKQTQINQSDCSQWPNSTAVWDAASQTVICDCKAGYEWDSDYANCVPDQNSQVRNADCSAYHNTGPRWDDTENGVVCDCIYGYEWNSDYSGCEKALPEAPDCTQHYPNTRPVWDKKEGKYYCECIKGYEWNQGRTGCEPTEFTAQTQGSSACKGYGPATGKWNSSRGAYDCYCKSGYVWNANQTYCITDPNRQQAIDNIIDAGMTILQGLQGGNTNPWTGGGGGGGGGTPDNPTVATENQHPGVCNTVYGSGANAPESYSIPIQQGFGTNYKFYYDHISVKDRTHVYYGGQKIFDTGCVGGSATIELNLSGYGGNVTVIVDPN